MDKKIGIVGLGLIGGSMARALKAKTTHTVYGYDSDSSTLYQALADKSIDAELNENVIKCCDTIIIALYPSLTCDFVKSHLQDFKSGTVIIDCSGVKKKICDELSDLCTDNGLYFIGGHPMAGTEKSGYAYSSATLFDDAYMILCEDSNTNTVALKAAELLFTSIGFGSVTITSAARHDEIIAFTSQLAHLVSNAYIKSSTAGNHKGFSAGSYKDMTRVAYLNEEMWTELFFANKENLLNECYSLIDHLKEYCSALENDDTETMQSLLLEGKIAKAKIG